MIRLSEALAPVMAELRLNHMRQQTIRELEARIAELEARRQFIKDPSPENMTAWCDAQDALDGHQ